ARSTTGAESSRHEHPVSLPDHLIEGCLGSLPGFVPAFVVRQHGVVAVHDTVLQGDHHYVGVVEPSDAVVVATRVGIQGRTHDLHVLLRHRLLPQPGGLEGLSPLVESFDMRDHTVAEPEYKVLFRRDLDSIPTPEMRHRANDYTVAGVDHLIDLGPAGF